ncbi:hydroxycinnamoyl-coenzyme A shikimate/quinate hydroxycinnamoyltransferase [Trifolium pratense]|uniref:Hydroxycinnamoyl-coenzyme A shikimate/quinate hydroxycinnamoyltransferase n=1 Tax=Trifolium pratense TaxID=57577 RepID=A0A2K3N849_TRIPR|nr:hydroxycinnamoyl-coenzyme A shikimate/quinate hydroxycinnamoyltransferase [Trifolium pratense]
MTTIKAFYTVTPNESTPKGCLWLSDLDQVRVLGRLSHSSQIYIYKPKNKNQNKRTIIETLKKSLSKILVHYYPIAGRCCYKEGGRIELDLNAKGAVLIEAETTKTIHDYGDFSPSDSTKELIPKVDYNQPIEEIPLFVAQVTRFQSFGFAIGIAYSHPLSDGVGCFNLMNSWAKISRGETLEDNELPFFDRTVLKFLHTPIEPRFDHIELKPLPLILGRPDTDIERKKKITAEFLKLTAEEVEKLKKKANEYDIPKGSRRPYSRFEAITAHIWKSASKARELSENQPSVVRFSVGIRNRIIPNLPKNYYGNALIQTAATSYIGEIKSKPLSYLAQRIREGNELITNEYIRSQIDVIRGFQHLDDARKLFLGGEGKNAAYFVGNPNLHITSWMAMPAYEADFGWGKPFHIGMGSVSPFDKGLILMSPDGDGSVIVCMHFQVELMKLFKKFFYGDLYKLFSSSRL